MYQIRRILLIASVSGLMFIALTSNSVKPQMAAVVKADPQKTVAVAPFNSIELHNSVKGVLRYGPVQRLTLVKGSPEVTQIAVSGERLTIDKCRDKCPRGYELEVEIVTPHITAISVDNGALIESRGGFPVHTALSLAVSQGGTIDVRSILAQSISASVNQGGRILAKPETTLAAAVSNGGVITYWGNAQVTSLTQRGGMVTKGAAADLEKPLSDFDSSLNCPASPPVPPPPVKRSRTIVI